MKIKKLQNFFSHLSIRTKYIAAALLLLTTFFISSIYICFHSYTNAYQENLETAKRDFENSYREMADFEKRMIHLSVLFQSDKETVSLLSNISSFSASQYQQARQEILPLLYSMSDGSGDYFCRLYVQSSLDLIDSTSRMLNINSILKEPWAEEVVSGWGSYGFYSADTLGTQTPAFAIAIRDSENYKNLIAVLRIDLDATALTRKIEAPRSQGYATAFLQTKDFQTLASNSEEIEYSFPEAPSDTLDGFEAYQLNVMNQGKDTIFYQSLPYSHWRLVTIVHHDALQSAILPQLITLTVIGGFLSLSGFLCAAPILAFTISHICRFSNYVQKYSQSNLSTLPPPLEPLHHDEIGQLIDAHNRLLHHIQGLMKKQEKREARLRNLEISVLQAQINPHFLYNTLETVVWMSRMNQPDKVESTVRSLTRFYRLCLNKGEDILTVSQELEIVQHYFQVQSLRYEESFHLSINVPDEILGFTLPKITLQPLVENALLHGLLESDEPKKHIRIFGRRKNGAYELCIADSGAHFTEMLWNRIFSGSDVKKQDSSGESYGLKNVERRLCLYFKNSSVLYLDRSDSAYTCIVLAFPKDIM